MSSRKPLFGNSCPASAIKWRTLQLFDKQNLRMSFFLCNFAAQNESCLVAKKVLQYLAHAEGICLSGEGKYRTY